MKKKQKAQAVKHRPPENKQAAGRAGLSISEKKRLAELKRILAGNGKEQAKPDTAQKTITFKKMFRDGICQVTNKFYTKMVEFFDINYDLLEVEDQGDILEEYSKLINYFDPSIKFELFLFNRQVNEQALAEQFDIPLQNDDFDDIREEYTQMLKHQSAKGNNGILKSKYLIFGVESTGYKEAKVNGAAAILNDDVRQEIAEKVGDFYMLPSSIHETLIIPKDAGMEFKELEQMVQEVNQTQVAPGERLSDHVYEYDAKEHELFRSDRAEERTKQKEEKRDNRHERVSVKEKLAEKKDAVIKMNAGKEAVI